MKTLLKKLSFVVGLCTLIAFPSGLAQGAMQSSITQYGITWTFNGSYEVGQFVTGDWWVVGPVTINSVSPSPTGTRNGSAVNPAPYGQGYDDRGKNYDTDENVTFPVTLSAGSSLISSDSRDEGVGVQNVGALQSQAVLTVVSSAPASGTFRPSYCGTYKQYFNISEINWSVLPSVNVISSAPSSSAVLPYVSKPRMDHVNNWENQWACAADNWANNNGHNCYGRDYSDLVGIAGMYVMLDTSDQEQLAYDLIQIGIDNYGVLKAGGAWDADGGHNSGRKFPVVFAAILLDDAEMLDVGTDYAGKFGEDDQTYYSSVTGQPLWGVNCSSPYFPNGCSGSGSKQCKDPAELVDGCADYRTHNTSVTWVGQMLATLFIGGKSVWNHDAYFDYVDRWVNNGGGSSHAFISDMWTAYRDNLPSGGGSGTVAAPVFSPTGGSFTNAQSVTITTATSGATIRYTTNGSTPTSTSGTVYSTPVAISSTSTLKAIAYKSGMSDSSVTSDTYTINLDTTAPSVPTGLSSSNVTASSVDLDWNASTDNIGVTGYNIYTNGSDPVSLTGTSATVAGLSNSTSYTFTVSAYDAASNESSQSSGVNVTTDSLSGTLISEDFSSSAANFTAVSGGSWNVNSGRYVLSSPAGSGTSGVLGNISVHDTSISGDFSLSATMNITGTGSAWNDAVVIFGYQDSSNYYYVSLNESNDDNTKGILKVVSGTPTQLADISISVASDTDYPIEIERSGSSIVAKVNSSQVASATDSTFTSGKVGFGSYNDGAQFDNLVVTGASDTDAPSVPTGLTSSSVTTTSVDLSWNASTDNVAVTGYKVYTDGSNPVSVTGTSTTITGLTQSTSYTFTVSAVDAAANESSQSSGENVITADGQAPTTPTGLASSNITDASVDLSWNASTDNVAVAGYYVYTDGSDPVTVTGTSTTISGLSASTTYDFSVSAFDAASNESTATSDLEVTTAAASGTEITAVTASDNDGNVPSNTLDGDLGTRWSALGDGEWIEYELDDVYTLESIDIAFYKGDERSADFDIEVSTDGTNWTTVLSSATSGGSTLSLETFDVTDANAQYVRYVGYGNSANDWNSLTEVELTLSAATSSNLISNGEFDNGTTDWSVGNYGGTGSLSVATGEGLSGTNSLEVSISSAGSQIYSIQVLQDFPITNGETYTISFKAKADATKDVKVVIQDHDSPYTEYWYQDITVTTSAQSFGPYTFNCSTTDSTAYFKFFVSDDATTVYFDDVEITD